MGGNRLVADLAANDFETLRAQIAKCGGLGYLGGEINRTRVVFRYAWEAGLIDSPVRFGPTFKKPKKASLRKEARQNGTCRMFEPNELRRILDGANTQVRAMVLLGLNGGMGNSDLGQLRLTDIDLENGWLTQPRAKTQIDRRIPLWDETVAALRQVLPERPEPKSEEHADLVFVTRWGGPWHVDSPRSPLSHEFRKLLQRLDREAAGTQSPLYKPRRGFYALRHTFQTVGEEAGEVATRFIMGHADNSMSAVYREHISDERLGAVTEHVRSWLYGGGSNGE